MLGQGAHKHIKLFLMNFVSKMCVTDFYLQQPMVQGCDLNIMDVKSNVTKGIKVSRHFY